MRRPPRSCRRSRRSGDVGGGRRHCGGAIRGPFPGLDAGAPRSRCIAEDSVRSWRRRVRPCELHRRRRFRPRSAPRRGCRPWTPRREGIRYTPRCRPGLPRAPGTHLVEVAVPARSSKCWGLVEPERLRRHRAQCEIDRFAFRRGPVATHDLGASLVANVDIGACHVYRMHQKGTKSTPAFRGARLDYGYEWSLAYGQPARSSRFPSRSRRCIRTATLDRWNACAGNCRINPSCRYSSTGVQHGQTRREATERASRAHTGGAGD